MKTRIAIETLLALILVNDDLPQLKFRLNSSRINLTFVVVLLFKKLGILLTLNEYNIHFCQSWCIISQSWKWICQNWELKISILHDFFTNFISFQRRIYPNLGIKNLWFAWFLYKFHKFSTKNLSNLRIKYLYFAWFLQNISSQKSYIMLFFIFIYTLSSLQVFSLWTWPAATRRWRVRSSPTYKTVLA